MTDRARIILDALIKALKNDTENAYTPEVAIDFVKSKLMDNINMKDVTEQEVEEYIYNNW